MNDKIVELYQSQIDAMVDDARRDAIDEFLNRIEDEGECGDWIEISRYKCEEIAEQMKGEK